MEDLKARYGSWALITGGTSGIGAELARKIGQAGMNLVIVARTQANLDTQAAALRKELGIEVRVVAADLSASGATATVIEAVQDLEIGMLVLSAAMESKGYFVDETLARHRALVQMDVVGPLELAHHFRCAKRVHVAERTAAEGREPETEDRTDVAVARRTDHTLLEAPHCLVQHREDSPQLYLRRSVFHTERRLRVARRRSFPGRRSQKRIN